MPSLIPKRKKGQHLPHHDKKSKTSSTDVPSIEPTPSPPQITASTSIPNNQVSSSNPMDPSLKFNSDITNSNKIDSNDDTPAQRQTDSSSDPPSDPVSPPPSKSHGKKKPMTLPFFKITDDSGDSLKDLFDSKNSSSPISEKSPSLNPIHVDQALHSPIEFSNFPLNDDNDESLPSQQNDPQDSTLLPQQDTSRLQPSSAPSLSSPFSYLKTPKIRNAKRIFTGSSRKVSGSSSLHNIATLGASNNTNSTDPSSSSTSASALNKQATLKSKKSDISAGENDHTKDPDIHHSKQNPLQLLGESIVNTFSFGSNNNSSEGNDSKSIKETLENSPIVDTSKVPPEPSTPSKNSTSETHSNPTSGNVQTPDPEPTNLSDSFPSVNSDQSPKPPSENRSISSPSEATNTALPDTTCSSSVPHPKISMDNINDSDITKDLTSSSLPSEDTLKTSIPANIPSSHSSLFASVFGRDKKNNSSTNLFGVGNNASSKHQPSRPTSDVDPTPDSPRKPSRWKLRTSSSKPKTVSTKNASKGQTGSKNPFLRRRISTDNEGHSIAEPVTAPEKKNIFNNVTKGGDLMQRAASSMGFHPSSETSGPRSASNFSGRGIYSSEFNRNASSISLLTPRTPDISSQGPNSLQYPTKRASVDDLQFVRSSKSPRASISLSSAVRFLPRSVSMQALGDNHKDRRLSVNSVNSVLFDVEETDHLEEHDDLPADEEEQPTSTQEKLDAQPPAKKFEAFFKNPFHRNNTSQSPVLAGTALKSKRSIDFISESLAPSHSRHDANANDDSQPNTETSDVPQLKISTPSMDSLKPKKEVEQGDNGSVSSNIDTERSPGLSTNGSSLGGFGLGSLSIGGSQRKTMGLRNRFNTRSKEKIKEKKSIEKKKKAKKSKSSNSKDNQPEGSDCLDETAVDANVQSDSISRKSDYNDRSSSFENNSSSKNPSLSPGFTPKCHLPEPLVSSPSTPAELTDTSIVPSDEHTSANNLPSTAKSSKSFFSSLNFASNIMSDHSSGSTTANAPNYSLDNAPQTPESYNSNGDADVGNDAGTQQHVTFEGTLPTTNKSQPGQQQQPSSSLSIVPFPGTQSSTSASQSSIASTLKAPLYRFRRKTASMLFSNDNDGANSNSLTNNHNMTTSEITIPAADPNTNSSPTKSASDQQLTALNNNVALALSGTATGLDASSGKPDTASHPYMHASANSSRSNTPTHHHRTMASGALFSGNTHGVFSLHRTLSSQSPNKEITSSSQSSSPASSTFQLVNSRPRSRTMSSLDQKRSSTPSGFFSYKHSDTNLISLKAASNNAELRYGGNNGLNNSSYWKNDHGANSHSTLKPAEANRSSGESATSSTRAVSGSGSVGTANAPPMQPRPSTQAAIFDVSNVELPSIDEDESPATYLKKVRLLKLGGNLAGALARVDDDFHRKVLKLYVNGFHFQNEPLDMSLRKFLISVKLPRETQQIDRVLEAFAFRYHECNAGIYNRPEDAYFVAFSLVLLHTDYFNPNNKFKMQKADYLKIKSEKDYQDIPEDILSYFYDNITYTPFIHTEEDILDPGSQTRVPWVRRGSTFVRSSREPLDPYSILLEGKLDAIRPKITIHADMDPYDFFCVKDREEMVKLRDDFENGPSLQLISQRSRPEAYRDDPHMQIPGVVDIKIVKAGFLYRSDAKRKGWKKWGIILTASRLYTFKDVNWFQNTVMAQLNVPSKSRKYASVGNTASSIAGNIAGGIGKLSKKQKKEAAQNNDNNTSSSPTIQESRKSGTSDNTNNSPTIVLHQGQEQNSSIAMFRPMVDGFHPDSMLFTNEMAALYYANEEMTKEFKFQHAFLLIGRGGSREWFAGVDEQEAHEWMKKINFAASFSTFFVAGMQGVSNLTIPKKQLHRMKSLRRNNGSPASSPKSAGNKKSGNLTDTASVTSSNVDNNDSKSIETKLSTSSRNASQATNEISSPKFDDNTSVSDTQSFGRVSTTGTTDSLIEAAVQLNQRRLLERQFAVSRRLDDITRQLEQKELQLDEQRRTARHVQILAPILSKTRDNVLQYAGSLAAQLDWNWMERKKLQCYQNFFSVDLEVEQELCRSLGANASLMNNDTPSAPVPTKEEDTKSIKSSKSSSGVESKGDTQPASDFNSDKVQTESDSISHKSSNYVANISRANSNPAGSSRASLGASSYKSHARSSSFDSSSSASIYGVSYHPKSAMRKIVPPLGLGSSTSLSKDSASSKDSLQATSSGNDLSSATANTKSKDSEIASASSETAKNTQANDKDTEQALTPTAKEFPSGSSPSTIMEPATISSVSDTSNTKSAVNSHPASSDTYEKSVEKSLIPSNDTESSTDETNDEDTNSTEKKLADDKNSKNITRITLSNDHTRSDSVTSAATLQETPTSSAFYIDAKTENSAESFDSFGNDDEFVDALENSRSVISESEIPSNEHTERKRLQTQLGSFSLAKQTVITPLRPLSMSSPLTYEHMQRAPSNASTRSHSNMSLRSGLQRPGSALGAVSDFSIKSEYSNASKTMSRSNTYDNISDHYEDKVGSFKPNSKEKNNTHRRMSSHASNLSQSSSPVLSSASSSSSLAVSPAKNSSLTDIKKSFSKHKRSFSLSLRNSNIFSTKSKEQNQKGVPPTSRSSSITENPTATFSFPHSRSSSSSSFSSLTKPSSSKNSRSGERIQASLRDPQSSTLSTSAGDSMKNIFRRKMPASSNTNNTKKKTDRHGSSYKNEVCEDNSKGSTSKSKSGFLKNDGNKKNGSVGKDKGKSSKGKNEKPSFDETTGNDKDSAIEKDSKNSEDTTTKPGDSSRSVVLPVNYSEVKGSRQSVDSRWSEKTRPSFESSKVFKFPDLRKKSSVSSSGSGDIKAADTEDASENSQRKSGRNPKLSLDISRYSLTSPASSSPSPSATNTPITSTTGLGARGHSSQRSDSLVRKKGENITLLGKQFRVVEVNPEFGGSFTEHKRAVSQNFSSSAVPTSPTASVVSSFVTTSSSPLMSSPQVFRTATGTSLKQEISEPGPRSGPGPVYSTSSQNSSASSMLFVPHRTPAPNETAKIKANAEGDGLTTVASLDSLQKQRDEKPVNFSTLIITPEAKD